MTKYQVFTFLSYHKKLVCDITRYNFSVFTVSLSVQTGLKAKLALNSRFFSLKVANIKTLYINPNEALIMKKAEKEKNA